MRLIMKLIMRVFGHYEPLETPNLIMIVSLIIRCIMRLLGFQCDLTLWVVRVELRSVAEARVYFLKSAVVARGELTKPRACTKGEYVS